MSRTHLAAVPSLSEPRPDRRWLRLKDVAEALSVSEGMVRKLIRTRHLPAIYVGRFPRIEQRDLDAYLEGQREAASRRLGVHELSRREARQ